jgi:hypothetical protein
VARFGRIDVSADRSAQVLVVPTHDEVSSGPGKRTCRARLATAWDAGPRSFIGIGQPDFIHGEVNES